MAQLAHYKKGLCNVRKPRRAFCYHDRMEAVFWLAFAAFIVWAGVHVSRRASLERARKADEALRQQAATQVAEACRYIEEVNRARAFPTVWLKNVNARPGEFGLLHEQSTLFEPKTRRYSVGAGTRVKLGKVPIYLGGAQSVPVESLDPAADGDLYLTNRRVLFLSDTRSAAVALDDVIGVDAGSNQLTVHSGKRQKPLVLRVTNPAKWVLLAKLLSSEELKDPALPEGLTLKAESTNQPGEINFSATRSSAGAVAHAQT